MCDGTSVTDGHCVGPSDYVQCTKHEYSIESTTTECEYQSRNDCCQTDETPIESNIYVTNYNSTDSFVHQVCVQINDYQVQRCMYSAGLLLIYMSLAHEFERDGHMV